MTEKAMCERGRDNDPDGQSVPSERKSLYYGTRAGLRPGDVIAPGNPSGLSNDGADASFTYLSPDLDAAIWSAELAQGEGSPRVYVVETDNEVEDASEVSAKSAGGQSR